MRLASVAILALAACAVAACDDVAPPTQPATSTGDPDAALKNAAKNECAAVTNYLPEKLAAMTPEMRALTEREYNLCVSKVGGGS